MRNLLALLLVCFSLCGCVMMLVGAGAAGGYAVGRDYIQGEMEKSFDSVYASALQSVESLGIIESKYNNSSVGKINAKVETSSLQIIVERLTRHAVRLRVKSRKNLLPNLDLAQRVYSSILEEAR